ncbi:MAG: SpoIIE family protein phosphatase, partial [Bdellovibrionota bacterium]
KEKPVEPARAALIRREIFERKYVPSKKPKAYFVDASKSYVAIGRTDETYTIHRLSELLASVWKEDLTTIRLVEPDGRIVASSHSDEVGESIIGEISRSQFASIASFKSKFGGFEGFGRGGTKQLISFSVLAEQGLLLVATTPLAAISRATMVFIAQSVGSLFALLGLAALASMYLSNSLVTSFRKLSAVMDAIQKGDFTVRAKIESRDEIGALAGHLNKTAEQLASLVDTKMQSARFEEDLKTAKTVQETLFPPSLSRTPHGTVIGHYQPANEVSGDWWYTFVSGEKLYVIVADVTGHGIAAALLTSAAKAAVTMLQERENLGPARLLTDLNRVLYATSGGKRQMTMFVGMYEADTMRLTYASASHEFPFVLSNSGEDDTLLDSVGKRLGESPDSTYTEAAVIFPPASTLIVFTDGIYELENEKNRKLSDRALLKMVRESRASSSSAEGMMNNLKAGLSQYHKQTGLPDDLTLLLFQN